MNIEDQILDLSSPGTSGSITTLEDFLSKSETTDELKEIEVETEDVVIPIESLKEEKKEDDKEVKVVDTTDKVLNAENQSSVGYKDFISKMVSLGKWESFDTIETEEGEFSIDDIEITDELFQSIVEEQEKLKEERLATKNLDGVSDFTKRLIEIEKKGGSVSDAIRAFETVGEPLSKIDTSTIEGKRAVIYMQLKAQGQQDESDIKRLISSYEKDGVLEDKAEKAEVMLNNAYNDYLQSIEDAAEQERKEKQERLKNYKKDFAENLSKTFEITSSIKSKLVDIASKQDENGMYEMDKIYNDYRRNPEKAAKLALFLYNEDEYIKQVTNSTKVGENLKVFRNLSLTNKGVTNSMNFNTKSAKDDDIIPLDIFNKK
jgi:hypothetical protein